MAAPGLAKSAHRSHGLLAGDRAIGTPTERVAFFQAVQAVLAKRAPGEARPEEELDHTVRQIIAALGLSDHSGCDGKSEAAVL